jgi:hypothetical protein
MTTVETFGFLDMEPLDLGDEKTPPVIEETGLEDPSDELFENSDPPSDDLFNDEPEISEDPLISIANGLLERGFIKEIPEGVDAGNFDEAGFWKTFEHNKALEIQEAINQERSSLADSITDTTRQLIAYDIENPNLTDEEMLEFIQGTVYAKQITNLDPRTQPEQILRQYYGTIGWSGEEVEQKLADLAETNKLQSEAALVKPKLDKAAQQISEEKILQQRRISDHEAKMYNHLKDRTVNVLKKGEINGVPLTQEEVNIIYNSVLNQDVDVPVRGGKSVKMGVLEAMVYKHKYTQDGNLENLMLAALVMQRGPEALEKFYKQQTEKKVLDSFVRETKAGALRTQGKTNKPTSGGSLFKLRVN